MSTYGGRGALGIVRFTDLASSIGNIPDFSADVTTQTPGLLIHFTDLSTIKTTGNLTYLWTWGDGTTSNTTGDQIHIYSFTGVYTVSLTISSDAGVATTTKSSYIVITNAVVQNTWWTPHVVQVTVMDTYGQRLAGLNITATYNESSMPEAWVNQLYGIQGTTAGEIVNKSLVLGGTTGSDGTITFTMLGSLKYDIYLTSATYGLDRYHVSAYPKDDMLNIYVTTNGDTVPIYKNSSVTTMNNTRVYVLQPNVTTLSMCIDYQDISGSTSSILEKWYFANNNTIIDQQTITNPGTTMHTNCYTMPNTRGVTTYWGYNASRVT